MLVTSGVIWELANLTSLCIACQISFYLVIVRILTNPFVIFNMNPKSYPENECTLVLIMDIMFWLLKLSVKIKSQELRLVSRLNMLFLTWFQSS